MQRRIPLNAPQKFPQQWERAMKGTNKFQTESQLRPREGWMDEKFDYCHFLTGINTKALVYAAMHALSTTTIPTITYDCSGIFNHIFRIQFPDGFKLAARILKQDARADGRVESIVATMTMARHFDGIPAPEVYAWYPDNGNPVGGPYILLEWVEGIEPWHKLHKLPAKDLTKMLDELATHHAKFAKPLPFHGVGSIYFAVDSSTNGIDQDLTAAATYRLGPLSRGPTCTVNRGISTWPQTTPTSLRQFWMELWEHEVNFMTKMHGSDRSTVVVDEKHPNILIRETRTLGQFLDLANAVLSLVKRCPLPSQPELYAPCLASTDYALRNIKMDPWTLNVTSFIDWDDVYTMPFLLSSRYPEEICWSDGAGERYKKSGEFTFLPIDEEGELEEDLVPAKAGSEVLSETSLSRDAEGGDDDDDTDTYYSDSASQASKVSESASILDSDYEAYNRPRRIRDTRLRREYEQLLANHDSRFGIEGFWDIRSEALKIQHLLTYGWIEWCAKEEWLMERASELRAT